MDKKNNTYFPLLVDLKKFNCLVVGGGNIAYRKVLNVLEFGGQVTVISPNFSPGMHDLIESGKVLAIQKKYERGDVEGYNLVFCATGYPLVDNMVEEDCNNAGVLLNVADVPEMCNFIMPSTIKRGDFIIALSSQGEAPFFVKEKRMLLERFFSPIVADVTALAGEFRRKLMTDPRFENTEKRYVLFQKFLTFYWEKIIYDEGLEAAYKKMEELFD